MNDLNDEFVKAPEKFMNKYAIMMTGTRINSPNTNNKISIGNFSFQSSGVSAVGAADVLILQPDVNGMPAYWLSYEDNKSKRAILGRGARFMFTATMSGCSFGYGNHIASGEVLVGHANAADIGQRVDEAHQSLRPGSDSASDGAAIQRRVQNLMLTKKMRLGTLRIADSKLYMHDAYTNEQRMNIDRYSSSIIGVRTVTTSNWKFYMQRRTLTVGGQYVLRDTISI